MTPPAASEDAAGPTLPARPYHIAFVCLGNICRSPTAEQVFRARLATSPLAGTLVVTSGGTSGWHAGDPMDRRAAATLRRHGYGTDHTGSRFGAEELAAADLVLAMDAANVAALRSLVDDTGLRGRIRLLRSFDPGAPAGAEVPDPYYGDADGFETVLAMVERAADGLLAHLERELL